MAEMKKYGSDLIVDVLKAYDFDYVSLNPGSSFRGLHDSLVNYGENKRPEMIECCHEQIAVGMAHGYAKASGKPMLAIVHNLVGLLHGTMAIYYAYLDRVPVIVIGATGPMDVSRRRPHIDWIHTALVQGNTVREYVKWDDQPYSIESVPGSFARAYRVAMTEPKGPVYMCYDVMLQEDPVDHEVPLPDPSRLAPPPPIQAQGHVLDEVATHLLRANNPVILAGYVGRNPSAVSSLVELAETLAVPVLDMNHRFNFPNTHELDLTGNRDLLHSADLVLSLDMRDLYGALTQVDESTRTTSYVIPKDCKIVEVGFGDLELSSWSQDFQEIQGSDLSVLADTSAALPEIVERCRRGLVGDSEKQERIGRRSEDLRAKHEATRRRWLEESEQGWDKTPMTTGRLAREIWEVIKEEDWVLTANTLRGWARKLWTWDRPYRHVGKDLGTGTQIGISLGVALAYKGSDKLVVDIQPDGDLLFDVSALWTAAYHKIPMLVVMYNNRSYYNDWDHQIRMAMQRGTPKERAYIGMELDNPAPDFARIAQSFGWYAEGPIENGDLVHDALKRAIHYVKKEKMPALVDTVTQYR